MRRARSLRGGANSFRIRGCRVHAFPRGFFRFSDLQFVLDYQGAGSHDRVLLSGSILDDDDVVAVLSQHVIELLLELLLADVADRGQHAEAVEEARAVIGATKGSQFVALRQGGRDIFGDEVLGEEALLVGVGDGDGRDYGGRRHCEIGLNFLLY